MLITLPPAVILSLKCYIHTYIHALEAIESLNRHSINPRTATIFTDSRISLDSFHNPNNHAFLVEEIRKKVASLKRSEWKIMFLWVKAHTLESTAMSWLIDWLKKRCEVTGLSMSSTEYPRAPYTMKQQKKLNKNGKPNGQHATRRPQQNSISHHSGTD